ncbi:MAG TPA: hypothetical protein VFY49_06570 [Myxococcota bacterium]|nr:hypothetical protein [Myxococcota bacterium]
MRSYEVFAAMTPERAVEVMRSLSKKSPALFRQAVDAAAVVMRARPVYLRNQPFEKRAEAIRRTFSRVAANPVADELLAVYFLECRKELLVEWLDLLGVKHEDGMLSEDAPAEPPEAKLRDAVKKYLAASDDPDRDLLLRAFAAQHSIEWPTLDALLGAPPA